MPDPVREAPHAGDPQPGSAPGLEPPSLAAATPTVRVSVLIPVLDEELHVEESVAAMLAQDVDGAFELLFIDGRSQDRTVEILRGMQADEPRIRILDNPHRTTARALNVGLAAARGEYVARMDAHTHYPAGYLRIGIERLEQGDVDWVTGPQVPEGRGYWSGIVATALAGGLGRGSSDKWQAQGEATPEEWDLSTSVFTGVWRRATLDELGGWDPEWPVNQDSEMAARVLARGGRIVCRTDMGARYVPRDSLRTLGRQYRRYGTYRARTFVRHPSSCGPVRIAASGLPVGLASALLPGRLGWAGRRFAGLYALAIGAQVGKARPAGRDAPALALVLVTMHTTWGLGFLQSVLRLYPGRRALRQTAPQPIRRPDR